MLTLVAACDNVRWGGADVAVVKPPPKAGALPASAEDLAEKLPEGPILFYVTPTTDGGTMIPVGEISGEVLRPLRARKDANLFATRFIAANMRRGAEFVLYRNSARVGTFVIQNAQPAPANACPALPRATGQLELSAGAEKTPEFLAIAKTHAPEIGRQLVFPTQPTRAMQVIAPILAEKMIRARHAQLPANWMRAMAELKPFPIANQADAGFAATFLIGDQLATGAANPGAYSLFFLGIPGAQFGFDTTYVRYDNYAEQGKAAPRLVDVLDWNRDGQVDLLLQVYGENDTWFEAVGRGANGKWKTTFRDRCARPSGTSELPTRAPKDSAGGTATTTTR